MTDHASAMKVLVLQGGGALGSYQAGVFEALANSGHSPDWVAGISIGAINAALIAGNPIENCVSRLEEFWQLVTSGMTPMRRRSATVSASSGTRWRRR